MPNLARDPESIRCPNCAEWINSEAILCRFCHCGLSSTHFQPCSFCAEMVRMEATRCRYCQSDLPEAKQRQNDMRPFEPRVIRSMEPEPSFKANFELIDERVEVLMTAISRELQLTGLDAADLDAENQTRIRQTIREMVNSDSALLTMMERGLLLQKILDEVVGFGPLGPLLRDPSLRDIYVYGPSHVHVERVRRGIEKTDVVFKDDEHINAIIERIFKGCGARLSKKALVNSCSLPNGTVVIAVLSSSPGANDEAMLILRTPRTST